MCGQRVLWYLNSFQCDYHQFDIHLLLFTFNSKGLFPAPFNFTFKEVKHLPDIKHLVYSLIQSVP